MSEQRQPEERAIEALGDAPTSAGGQDRRSALARAFWICLVVAYFVAAFLIILPRFDHDNGKTKEDLARAQIAAGGSLDSAINQRRLAMGQYPAALSELTTWPAGVHHVLPTDPQALRDPWNNPYQYHSPGGHHADSFDLWSMGADGVSGTADDIGNW